MKEKKHIDRLFQEKFKDFEAQPREKVWKAISAELKDQNEKKPLVRSLWTRAAGVAAILSLIFLIGDWFSTSQPSQIVNQNEEVRDTPDQNSPQNENVSVASHTQDEPLADEATAEDFIAKAIKVPRLEIVYRASSIEPAGLNSLSTAPILSEEAPANNEEEGNPTVEKVDTGISIFDAIAANEENPTIKPLGKGRLLISTQAAPIYYGNLGKGNFIDPQFSDNSREGEVTFAYGINVAYAISDKVKIRSGVKKVSMSYNTNGISYHTAIDPAAISSIDYHKDLDLQITDAPSKGGITGDMQASTNRARIGSFNPAFLNQKLGYIEVPVEVQYNLLDKKIEINLIGGGSTMFLDENVITLNSSQLTTELGEANNLNNVSFSTNIGLGVDYNLSEKFKLNLEPMFKYQLNTFSKGAGSNQPYYLGIYSGFSFKF